MSETKIKIGFYRKLGVRLEPSPTKPLNLTSVSQVSHCHLQLLNTSPPDSLLTAPYCPSRSYA